MKLARAIVSRESFNRLVASRDEATALWHTDDSQNSQSVIGMRVIIYKKVA